VESADSAWWQIQCGFSDGCRPGEKTGHSEISTFSNSIGQERPFATTKNLVGHRAVNRRSGPKAGHPPDSLPSNACSWTGILCQLPTLVDAAANGNFEPISLKNSDCMAD
jgi:hypothetical protein